MVQHVHAIAQQESVGYDKLLELRRPDTKGKRERMRPAAEAEVHAGDPARVRPHRAMLPVCDYLPHKGDCADTLENAMPADLRYAVQPRLQLRRTIAVLQNLSLGRRNMRGIVNTH